jgi:hypothetical protein
MGIAKETLDRLMKLRREDGKEGGKRERAG